MTTDQIIMLILITIFAVIAFFGTSLSKNDDRRMNFIVLWLLSTGIFFIICFVSLTEMNKCKEQSKGICPEYEKIENVYKLKE